MRRWIIFVLGSLLILSLSAQDTIDSDSEYLIKSLYFGGGSYFVDDEQVLELYDFMDSIPDLHAYTISVHSHTDNIGGKAYNEWLSRMRSRSAISLLISKSIPPGAIAIKDFGQFNPIFDNSTWEGRARNRRVDIIFWPNTL